MNQNSSGLHAFGRASNSTLPKRTFRGGQTSDAFSLVELMAVLAIVGLLAGVIVIRVTSHNENAGIAACEANKTNIEALAELWLQNTGSWPATNLSDIGSDVNYFPSGLPVCPVDGSSYSLEASTGRVTGHNH